MNAYVNSKSLLAMTSFALFLGAGPAVAEDKVVEPAFKHGSVFQDSRLDHDFRHGRGQRYSDQRELIEEIDRRQDRQMDRILDGLDNGRLTNREAVRLLLEQRQIARIERNYLADGFLSRFEYYDLDRHLDEADRHIFKEKHDRQVGRR